MPLLHDISGRERVGDAMGHMIAEYLPFYLVQGSPDRIDLRQHVHAITVVLNHAEQATNLTLNTPEPPGDVGLRGVMQNNQPLIRYP